MSNAPVAIAAEGIDTQKLVQDIRERVAKRMDAGDYRDARIALAERTNLANLQSEEAFLSFYLDCLRDAVFVDISDFDIVERRARFTSLLILLKRTIWKALKFYTYRLWSQQNQINGLLLAALEGMEIRYRDRTAELEKRIRDLEVSKTEPDAEA